MAATNQKRPVITPVQLQENISHQGMLERFLTYVMFLPNKEEGSVTFEHLHTDITRIHSFQMFYLFVLFVFYCIIFIKSKYEIQNIKSSK